MKPNRNSIGALFLKTALILLVLGLIFGALASVIYIVPEFLKNNFGLTALRPLHVSSVVFWILLAATGSIYLALENITPKQSSTLLQKLHLIFWWMALAGIFYSYFTKNFGGREYWEYPSVYALLVGIAWVLFLILFIQKVRTLRPWPVYIWMWMTGIVYFLFIFIENYLWVIPWFREIFVKDMVIQWKAAGSIVGAYNMLVYGVAFYLMERISKQSVPSYNKWAFALFFLSFFNMLFNWGHHLYLVPAKPYIHYIGYAVSMTEWVFFIKILWNWHKQVTEAETYYHYFPYRFLLASNFWLFFNLTLALFMSIPAINLYMHGTNFITAHAMGTTIGINTMILLAAAFEQLLPKQSSFSKGSKRTFWVIQLSLLLFLVFLLLMGIHKSIWFFQDPQPPFSEMMEKMKIWSAGFMISGITLAISVVLMVTLFFRKKFAQSNPNH